MQSSSLHTFEDKGRVDGASTTRSLICTVQPKLRECPSHSCAWLAALEKVHRLRSASQGKEKVVEDVPAEIPNGAGWSPTRSEPGVFELHDLWRTSNGESCSRLLSTRGACSPSWRRCRNRRERSRGTEIGRGPGQQGCAVTGLRANLLEAKGDVVVGI